MGTRAASEPLYSFIIVIYLIYDILIVFSYFFMTAHFGNKYCSYGSLYVTLCFVLCPFDFGVFVC